jgi:hypothetical protein
MGGKRRFAALCVACVGLLACACQTAAADSLLVPNTNWTALLPPLPGTPTEPQPGPVPNCEVASIACIDSEIARMQGEQAALGCDHRAVFDTTYLELTRGLRRTLDTDPGMFSDPDYLYTEDALFADIYFKTLEAWRAGEPVAPAWQIAFEQADHGQITGAQEMLLGINAHVQNDMPFVIAALGVRSPDGASRKHDHDAFNEVLNRAYESVVTAIKERYDPLIAATNPALVPADNIGGLEAVRGWRELVWRNAERLLTAKSDAQRQEITNQIEANAALWAQGIAAVQVPGIRQTRDAYCRQRLG